MKQIRDVITRMKWDPAANPEDYTIHYWDSVDEKAVQINGSDIARVEGKFIVLTTGREFPMHRIRKVQRGGQIVWQSGQS